MTLDDLMQKYVGRQLKPGQPEGYFWTHKPDRALWGYYFTDRNFNEIRYRTFVYYDDAGRITGIDDLEVKRLISEGTRAGSYSKRKARGPDYARLDEALAECIEE